MSDRNHTTGRFMPGNNAGVGTRYRPGQSGNRRGRPPRIAVFVRRYREQGLDARELSRIANDPTQTPNAHTAASRLLVPMLLCDPIPGSDAERARKVYRRFYRKGYDDLQALLVKVQEQPDRREAARIRLSRWR